MRVICRAVVMTSVSAEAMSSLWRFDDGFMTGSALGDQVLRTALTDPEQGRAGHSRWHHQDVDHRNQQHQINAAAEAHALPALCAQPGEHLVPAQLVVIRRVVDVLKSVIHRLKATSFTALSQGSEREMYQLGGCLEKTARGAVLHSLRHSLAGLCRPRGGGDLC